MSEGGPVLGCEIGHVRSFLFVCACGNLSMRVFACSPVYVFTRMLVRIFQCVSVSCLFVVSMCCVVCVRVDVYGDLSLSKSVGGKRNASDHNRSVRSANTDVRQCLCYLETVCVSFHMCMVRMSMCASSCVHVNWSVRERVLPVFLRLCVSLSLSSTILLLQLDPQITTRYRKLFLKRM